MNVTLVRRWGPHKAGKSVDVSDTQGVWLVQHNYAEGGPTQEPAAPGGNGPDPLAGGDATRRRPRVAKPERDPERNYARRAEGSSPTYRGGYGPEAAAREGEAGREQEQDTSSASSAGTDSETQTTRAAERGAERGGERGAERGVQEATGERAAKRRSK